MTEVVLRLDPDRVHACGQARERHIAVHGRGRRVAAESRDALPEPGAGVPTGSTKYSAAATVRPGWAVASAVAERCVVLGAWLVGLGSSVTAVTAGPIERTMKVSLETSPQAPVESRPLHVDGVPAFGQAKDLGLGTVPLGRFGPSAIALPDPSAPTVSTKYSAAVTVVAGAAAQGVTYALNARAAVPAVVSGACTREVTGPAQDVAQVPVASIVVSIPP